VGLRTPLFTERPGSLARNTAGASGFGDRGGVAFIHPNAMVLMEHLEKPRRTTGLGKVAVPSAIQGSRLEPNLGGSSSKGTVKKAPRCIEPKRVSGSP
jgi:hypothetical protein